MSGGPHRVVTLAHMRTAAQKCRRRCSACEQIRKRLTQRRSKDTGQLVYVCKLCEQLLDSRARLE